MNDNHYEILPEDIFEQLGDGNIAYVRPVRSDDVQSLFPGAPALAPGQKLWALLNANGTPILLTDSRSAAIAKAHENDFETLSVH